MQRRTLLAAALAAPLAAPFLAGCARRTAAPPPGSDLDSGLALGHRLRDGGFAATAPVETRRVGVLIVGAGIGGLSAAWRLQRRGMRDFALVELADRAGGNARYADPREHPDATPAGPHPLGAHYLPLPTRESVHVRELLADLGALEGDPQAARPVYDERRLCHAPQERLYRDGFWQEGVIPERGLTRAERDEIRRFLERMAEFRAATDSAGRRAFALPIDASSPDPRWRALDRQSMADWLAGAGFRAAPLHWYVDYACRDDFGTGLADTSAWAAIHYFACRDGEAANAPPDAVLTAPEGNGWIVRALRDRLAGQLHPGHAVIQVSPGRGSVEATVWLNGEQRAVRYRASRLIWAAPLFLLPRVLAAPAPATLAAALDGASWAPWLVANLTLAELPAPGAGAPLAWDNVLYGSSGLGYVVAGHQNLARPLGPAVLTWYHALAGRDPAAERQALRETPHAVWAGRILGELGRAHADLPRLVQRLDLFRHGHAMIRPLPGRLWHPARRALARDGLPGLGIELAHADVSGLSLFEEANARGVAAADRVLAGA